MVVVAGEKEVAPPDASHKKEAKQIAQMRGTDAARVGALAILAQVVEAEVAQEAKVEKRPVESTAAPSRTRPHYKNQLGSQAVVTKKALGIGVDTDRFAACDSGSGLAGADTTVSLQPPAREAVGIEQGHRA